MKEEGILFEHVLQINYYLLFINFVLDYANNLLIVTLIIVIVIFAIIIILSILLI